jgi:hypothetical protein
MVLVLLRQIYKLIVVDMFDKIKELDFFYIVLIPILIFAIVKKGIEIISRIKKKDSQGVKASLFMLVITLVVAALLIAFNELLPNQIENWNGV